MSKTTQQSTTPGAMESPDIEAAASFSNAMVDSMMQASQACMEGFLAASQESASFVNRRLDTDAKTCNRLASCRCYEDVAQVQQDWVATALEDYTKEWFKMAQVFADRMNGGATPATTGAKPKSAPKTSQSAAPGDSA